LSTERIGANKTATFKAVEVGNTDAFYDIEMKNCDDQFYVYKLRPTGNEESGYCFGKYWAIEKYKHIFLLIRML
jgi:hypothetical protein